MNSQIREYDIVIVGAGLAGATLACALEASDLRVALLDRSPPPQSPQGDYELRVSSLNRGSEKILKKINAWPFIDETRAYPYQRVQVCQENSSACVTFDSAQAGEPYMGHMIENVNVVHALAQRAAANDNTTLMDGIAISGLKLEHDIATLITDQGEIHAGLVVGADGPRSFIRKFSGFDEIQGFYGQQCIVGTIQFDGDHRQTAWQKFLSTGPLGILPLAQGYCSLAWSCENEFASQRLEESEDEFIAALEVALDGHLGHIIAAPQRLSYPLSHMHPQKYVAHRLALIGDAAHTIHPLAGLGANLGIMDAAALAKVINEKSGTRHFDPGRHEILRRYERWRKPLNQVYLSTMSALNMAFSPKMKPFSQLRAAGLRIADKITPAKHLMMLKAMGLDSDTATLAQGGKPSRRG